MRMLSIFAGIGGIDLAASWAGIETCAFVEIDPYCQAVLAKNFPGVPIFGDVHDVTAESLAGAGIPRPDIICGGFPCQPVSHAGQRKGQDDVRWLWPEMRRLIEALRPTWVVGENVSGLISKGLDGVLADLESLRYSTWTLVLPASAVGAPHQRERVFIVGRRNDLRSEYAGGQLVGDATGSGWQTSQCSGELSSQQPDGANTTVVFAPSVADTLSDEPQRDGITAIMGSAAGSGEATAEEWQRLWNTVGRGGAVVADAQSQRRRTWGAESAGFSGEAGTISNGARGPRAATTGSAERAVESCLGRAFDGVPKEMDRNSSDYRDRIILEALNEGAIEVDTSTGSIYSRRIRGKKGELAQLPGSDCNGYIVHSLRFHGEHAQVRAHRVVWMAAHGAIPNGLVIDHINRNRRDNRLANLRLADAKLNAENSPSRIGELNYSAKASKEDVQFIRQMYRDGRSCRTLAKETGLSKSQIHNIVTGKSWATETVTLQERMQREINTLLDRTAWPAPPGPQESWEPPRVVTATIPDRAKRLKALGNAVVPQQVYPILALIAAIEKGAITDA